MSFITPIDHETLALSRLLTQFSEAPLFRGYVRALLQEADVLENVFQEILDLRTLDAATGSTLDVIGVLVGQSRVLIDVTQFVFFGFVGAPGAASYGDLNDPGVGSRYISLGEDSTGNRKLTDDEYRVFIRARIARNNSKGTIDSVAELSAFISGATVVVIEDGITPAAFSIGFGQKLSNNAKVLLKNSDLIPKPAGVRIDYMYDFKAVNPFGFVGAPGGPAGYDVGEYAAIF